jgi:hypothetical protein
LERGAIVDVIFVNYLKIIDIKRGSA